MQLLTLEKRQQGGNSTHPRCLTVTPTSDTPARIPDGQSRAFWGVCTVLCTAQFDKRLLPGQHPGDMKVVCASGAVGCGPGSRKLLQQCQECEAEAGPKIRLCTQHSFYLPQG